MFGLDKISSTVWKETLNSLALFFATVSSISAQATTLKLLYNRWALKYTGEI